MKTLFITTAFLFLSSIVYCQEEQPLPPVEVAIKDSMPPLTHVEETAEYVGGREVLKEYLQQQLIYPKEVLQQGVEGLCIVRLIINQDGKISNATIMRGMWDCPDCDAEAIRVVKSMPDWIPAKVGGKPVSSYYNLAITFKLPEK